MQWYHEDSITESLLELFGNKTDVPNVAPETMVQNHKVHTLMSDGVV
jgi:hypothetical protein